jgi:hypothetical protein
MLSSRLQPNRGHMYQFASELGGGEDLSRLPTTSETPDHFYVNLSYFNDNTSPTNIMNQTQPATVTQSFSKPLKFNPNEYNLSIIRFSISSDTVPRSVQIPTGVTGGNTDLYVSLSYNGTYYTEPIVYPIYPNIAGPPIQAIYTIQQLLDLINAGYQAAQAEVALAGGPTGATGESAFMSYDPETLLFTMNSPVFYGTGGVGQTAGDGVGISMSYQLYHKFGGFNVIQRDPIQFNGFVDDTFVRDVTGYNYINNVYYPGGVLGATGSFLQLRQDVEWPSAIQDYNKLIITSQFLPTVAETTAQQTYSDWQGNSSNNFLRIVTDFLIGNDLSLISNSENFIYQPTLLRLASLSGNVEISQIDLTVYLGDKFGNIVPLSLNPLDYISAKIGFIRKGLSN